MVALWTVNVHGDKEKLYCTTTDVSGNVGAVCFRGVVDCARSERVRAIIGNAHYNSIYYNTRNYFVNAQLRNARRRNDMHAYRTRICRSRTASIVNWSIYRPVACNVLNRKNNARSVVNHLAAFTISGISLATRPSRARSVSHAHIGL